MKESYQTIEEIKLDAGAEKREVYSCRYVAIVNKPPQERASEIYLRSITDIYLKGIEEEKTPWIQMGRD